MKEKNKVTNGPYNGLYPCIINRNTKLRWLFGMFSATEMKANLSCPSQWHFP